MSAKKLEVITACDDIPHDSAHLHVAGESTYIDDRPFMPGELYVGLVLSPHAKAKITGIDASLAGVSNDVKAVLTAKDLHHNAWGSIFADQPLLADREVNYVGEVVALVAARSKEALKNAIPLVQVDYEVEEPILSIGEAIEKQSFIGNKKEIKTGDVTSALAGSPHQLSGWIKLKGADHFYLENQTAIAYPLEDGQLEVHSSTQHPSETQMVIAECLGLPQSSVVCIALRLGGGFGGKETQSIPFAVYAALVAHITGVPARLVLSKDDDMIATGKRNPYQIHYCVGFDQSGQIKALSCQFYGDGGAYADLSTSILERAMTHVDNAYFLPNAHISGVVCRTNFHPHTAFRGFGGPKGVAVIEHIVEEIAHYLKRDALDIRKLNCYQQERIFTPYGQRVSNNLLPELFFTLEERCDYRARRKILDEYNNDPQKNPRGMSLSAIKFGISFTTRFLNQGHALVHLLRDGSVQVATGAVEMGQGVQVRIKGLVAQVLGISPQMIRILPTATDKSANTSPTAASSGTDLNGSAAVIAATKLRDRIAILFAQLIDKPQSQWPKTTAPFVSMPEINLDASLKTKVGFKEGRIFLEDSPSKSAPFADLVNHAYLSRIPLSAYGFYQVPDLDFNKLTGQGRAFHYFTAGVACSEVEIDRFTGEVKVLRSDILMDVGRPINQAMDIGQITGGFVQGLGWVLSESLEYNPQGLLLSHAPSTYKIPSIHDMPRIFNIDLVKNDGNTINVYGTKAIGEPPLMLSFSVWNALKNAIAYYRKNFQEPLINLPVPATNEILLRALKPEAFSLYDGTHQI